MNKKDIMRQSSMELLIVEMIRFKPGVTSERLFQAAKEWAGKSWGHSDTTQFDAILAQLRQGEFRVTNKQWYPKGYVAARDPKGESKSDPRQVRMDW